MKLLWNTALVCLLSLNAAGVNAQETQQLQDTSLEQSTPIAPTSPTPGTQGVSAAAVPTTNSGGDVAQYLMNLGSFLGYDISKDPTTMEPKIQVSSVLFNAINSQLQGAKLIITLLQARPVNSILGDFLPGDKTLNDMANAAFKSPNYNTPSDTGISVSQLIDQQTYQNDPVNQAALNILGTPDSSICSYSNSLTEIEKNCPDLLYPGKIMSNIVGPLPSGRTKTESLYSYSFNQNVLGQLNSNSLLGPLVYGIEPASNADSKGLPAATQAKQANNFILYASGAVTPIDLVSQSDYRALYDDATAKPDVNGNVSPKKMQAQNILNNYVLRLRSFVARNSVGISNLYSILSKRIPQKDNGKSTSMAYDEYLMATRRLNVSTQNGGKSWIDNINNASPATVQKEIAILLAEMNYQLYLTRQQEERILLASSILLMQGNVPPRPAKQISSATPPSKS